MREGETLVKELAHFGAHWFAHGVRTRLAIRARAQLLRAVNPPQQPSPPPAADTRVCLGGHFSLPKRTAAVVGMLRCVQAPPTCATQ